MRGWKHNRYYRLPEFFFWGCLFAAWYFMRVADFPASSVAVMVTSVKVMVLALLVYLTNYVLIPRLLYKKHYGWFALSFLSLIIVIGLFKIYLILTLLQPYYRQPLLLFDDFRTKVYDDLLPLFLLVSTGAAVKLVTGYIVSEKRIADISREKAETELQFLKSQVNPHFVFNTLNSIYFQIDKSNHEARETLLQFSDLLRYQLYECNADQIAVEKELSYLSDYVRLQEKRKDSNYKVDWVNAGELKDFTIAPLLLMPLVENAFKHISHHTNIQNTISITAEAKQGCFYFTITNTTETGQTKKGVPYGGIGLKNVKRRLELLYPGRHELNIHEEEGIYSVYLRLQLHEN